jgi:hypothetical protein
LDRRKKEVMEITRWNNRVIPLTSIKQPFNCQACEIIVDEKRRMIEE